MALKTLVKVGSITNLSDARYCAGMGVDFLGFRVIEGEPGAITAKAFQEIRGWITGPQIVAEVYGIQSGQHIAKIMEEYLPDYFELSVDDFQKVGATLTLPFILRLKENEELPAFLSSKPAYILTDIHLSARSSKLIPEYELLINVNERRELDAAVGQTGISGVALNGGSEIRPGLRDFESLADILEALEEE